MTMNVLLVYSAAKFQIDSRIELMRKGKPIELIEPGERVLVPGVYRFNAHVGVNKVNGSVGESQMLPAPDEKNPWPDPPLVKMTSVLGVTKADLIGFLGGSNVETDLE